MGKLRRLFAWARAKLVDTVIDHWLGIVLSVLLASAASAVTRQVVDPVDQVVEQPEIRQRLEGIQRDLDRCLAVACDRPCRRLHVKEWD